MMGLDDFLDVLGKLHKLTECQRRAVAEALGQVKSIAAVQAEPARKRKAKASNGKHGYTDDEIKMLSDYVADEWSYTPKERQSIKKTFAMEFGRTAKAIDIQIGNIRVGRRATK